MNDDFIRHADEHQIRLAEIRRIERKERRQWWGALFLGVAGFTIAVTFILAVAAVIIDNVRGDDEVKRTCTEAGGSMVSLNEGTTCLHMDVKPQ